MDNEQINLLIKENAQLKEQNSQLLGELKTCRDDISNNIDTMTAIKKELRRYEVQLNSLKTENDEFKNKFAKIEGNFIGRFMLKIYRWLREIKRRKG